MDTIRVDSWIPTFYSAPPTEITSIDDIHGLVSERLELLKVASTCVSVEDFLSKSHHLPRHTRTNDMTSHHLLRLCLSDMKETSCWLCDSETRLFRFRLMMTSSWCYRDTLFETASCMVTFTIVDPDVWDESKAHYVEVETTGHDVAALVEFAKEHSSRRFIKIPFTAVPDEVSKRQLNMRDGFAHVPMKHWWIAVAAVFRESLESSLTICSRIVASVAASDDRIADLIIFAKEKFTSIVNQSKISVGRCVNGPLIDLQSLDTLAYQVFPPCMTGIHMHLRRKHHLKYTARIQYQLFLMSLGLGIRDALTLFLGEFAIGLGDELKKKQKKYEYSLRHLYGLEGRRIPGKPHSCNKIITNDAAVKICTSGCPYKESSPDDIEAMLVRRGVNDPETISRILLYVDRFDYKHACTTEFKYRFGYSINENLGDRGNIDDRVFDTPNDYAVSVLLRE